MATPDNGLEILNIPKEWITSDNLIKFASKLPPNLGATTVAHMVKEDTVWVLVTPGTPISNMLLLRSKVYDLLIGLGVNIYDTTIYVVKDGHGASKNRKIKSYDDEEVI